MRNSRRSIRRLVAIDRTKPARLILKQVRLYPALEHCRAARALLKWTQKELSDRTNISPVSIRFFEKEESDMRANKLRLLRLTFESAGLIIIDENGGGAGVRFTEPKETNDQRQEAQEE